jgi:hypothetical protein
MNRTADLDKALEFVIGRIEDEANRSGEPLRDEERFLLDHLPTDSALPQAWDLEFPTVLWTIPFVARVPRHMAYARLCALAKTVHNNDLRVDPVSALEWEYAVAVLKLNRHPMSWLLYRAGVKAHRHWSDGWLLIAAAVTVMSLMLLPGTKYWTRLSGVGIGAACVAVMVLLQFASGRIEAWQLKQTIERCRRSSSLSGLRQV